MLVIIYERDKIMQEYKVENHVSSYLPEGRNWKLVWADEFDGTELDRTKWLFRLNYWGSPAEAYTDQGVRLDGNGNVELHRVERNGYYVSPQLQTGSNSFDIPKGVQTTPWKNHRNIWPIGDIQKPTFMHRFGYYECRCKFQQHPEKMWSAFWTQSPSIGMTYDDRWSGVESDIMECFATNKATTGNIMGGYGKHLRNEGRVRYDLHETADGYHIFAMDWTPDGYTFYCDGEVVSTVTETVSQVPQFILLTTEAQGWRTGNPPAVGEKFEDDCFICDYVRVFDEV